MYVDTRPIITSPDVTDGVHELTFAGTEVGPSPFDSTKQRTTWKFTVPGKEGHLVWFTSTDRGDNLTAVLRGFGINVEVGKEQDVRDPAPGEKVQAFCQKTPSKKDPSRSFSRIISFLPKVAA